jgi:hypothetical protein
MPLKQEINNHIDIKILGVPPSGPGMPFLDSDTCAEEGGYLFLLGFFFPVWCHPWMDDKMNGWMEIFTKNDQDVLYYM